jgi:hypothetical protein
VRMIVQAAAVVAIAVSGARLASTVALGDSAGLATPSVVQAQGIKPYKASCVNTSFSGFVLKVRPLKCIMASSPNSSFAQASNLTGLRWKSWGSSRAIASGYEQGFHLPLAHTPATVVLTQPAYVEELGIYVYKHFRVTTRYGMLSGTVNAG